MEEISHPGGGDWPGTAKHKYCSSWEDLSRGEWSFKTFAIHTRMISLSPPGSLHSHVLLQVPIKQMQLLKLVISVVMLRFMPLLGLKGTSVAVADGWKGPAHLLRGQILPMARAGPSSWLWALFAFKDVLTWMCWSAKNLAAAGLGSSVYLVYLLQLDYVGKHKNQLWLPELINIFCQSCSTQVSILSEKSWKEELTRRFCLQTAIFED